MKGAEKVSIRASGIILPFFQEVVEIDHEARSELFDKGFYRAVCRVMNPTDLVDIGALETRQPAQAIVDTLDVHHGNDVESVPSANIPRIAVQHEIDHSFNGIGAGRLVGMHACGDEYDRIRAQPAVPIDRMLTPKRKPSPRDSSPIPLPGRHEG